MNRGTRTPTLEMVAAEAGVSRATVSRVVNGSTTVAPDIIAQVQAAVARLDYVPNRVARSLASRRADVIALIVPESATTVFADPFFAPVVRGVARVLGETDYTLNLLIASESRPEKTRRYLQGGNVDGALVVSHHAEDHSYVGLGPTLPMVFGGRPLIPGLTDHHHVDVDNVESARRAVDHLLGLGRTRVGTIAGRQDMPAGLDRFAGWRDGIAASGAGRASADLVEFGDFTQDSGAQAAERLLDRAPELDALFVANDQMAAGAMQTLTSRGRRVPQDVAVIGFDDDTFAPTLTPPLSTVRQPAMRFGEAMAEVLIALIAGSPVPLRTVIPTELVLRASA